MLDKMERALFSFNHLFSVPDREHLCKGQKKNPKNPVAILADEEAGIWGAQLVDFFQQKLQKAEVYLSFV